MAAIFYKTCIIDIRLMKVRRSSVAPSSSGLGRRPLKAEVAGSNPVGATKTWGQTYLPSHFQPPYHLPFWKITAPTRFSHKFHVKIYTSSGGLDGNARAMACVRKVRASKRQDAS